jgi:hypothetical protein
MVHPLALDGSLAYLLEAEIDEERRRGREVVNDDAHVVHPLNRHVLDCREATGEPARMRCVDRIYLNVMCPAAALRRGTPVGINGDVLQSICPSFTCLDEFCNSEAGNPIGSDNSVRYVSKPHLAFTVSESLFHQEVSTRHDRHRGTCTESQR